MSSCAAARTWPALASATAPSRRPSPGAGSGSPAGWSYPRSPCRRSTPAAGSRCTASASSTLPPNASSAAKISFVTAVNSSSTSTLGGILSRTCAQGQVPPEVPELLQVVLGGPLGGLDAEAGVPPGAAEARQVVLLLLLAQREELLAAVERPRDEVVGKAVILEYHEAVFLIRRTERLQRRERGRSGTRGCLSSGGRDEEAGHPYRKSVGKVGGSGENAP